MISSRLLSLLIIITSSAGAQGTFTAADCNFASVDTLINGPLHTAVSGDIIVIPAGNCTWTFQEIIPSGIGITIRGVGTPNTQPSQMGASSSCSQTVITDNSVNGLFQFTPSALVTSRVSCMKWQPFSPLPSFTNPIFVVGGVTACTTSQCPKFRFDNMTFPSSWNGLVSDNSILVVSNVFGVADHNNVGDDSLSTGALNLVNVNHGHWQGVGNNGDNSWATADTYGTEQAYYVENNVLKNAYGTDVDSGGTDYGGGRYACRFNSFSPPDLTCTNHGTDTTGRNRGGRQGEIYRNTWICPTGSLQTSCTDIFLTRSGPMLVFDNVNLAGGGLTPNNLFNLTVQRRWRGNVSFGQCGGQPDAGIWDATDSTNLGPFTISAVDTVNGIVTISTSPWTNGQFNSFSSPFSMVDLTQTIPNVTNGARANAINTNTTNSLTLFDFGGDWTPAVNDSIKIERATSCLDQSTRGKGALVTGDVTPVLQSSGVAGPVNEAIDPTYGANNSGTALNDPSTMAGEPGIIANRDYYLETINQGVQTSTTSPFNGSSGSGHGTLSLRPTTCTPAVGYWATDQGNWNQSGSGNQGQLFICSATNTGGCTAAGGNFWCLFYTPFTYPHPLTGVVVSGPPGVCSENGINQIGPNVITTKIDCVSDGGNALFPTFTLNNFAAPGLQGYYLIGAEITTGTPNPTANYTVTIKDSAGIDQLSGQATALPSTQMPQAFGISSSTLPLNGSPILTATGNSVNSAANTVSVYYSKTPPQIGKAISEKGTRWPGLTSLPAAGSQGTVSKAAAIGIRHVTDCVSFAAGSIANPVLTKLNVNLRDGATGAGTIIWTHPVVIPATAGQNVQPFSLCGLNLIGSPNTAMTLEFSSALTSLSESVSLSGYDIQ